MSLARAATSEIPTHGLGSSSPKWRFRKESWAYEPGYMAIIWNMTK